MNLVSMKMEGEEQCMPCPPTAYPYGLRLCLNDDQCEALGITGPISAGTKLRVEALTVVVRCSEEMEADGDDKGSDIYLDLQVTDMALAPANALYPNSKMKE